ncbi:MAG: histidinol-phosphate transaminase [Thermodesulfovibrionales bacterium]|nr:histidinol-phosphate transaminase [Thermodesulfovibrionales bacterium]
MLKSLDYVSTIKPYVPGKPIEELERELGIKECIKLASNENPLGPSPKALEGIKEFIAYPDKVSRYPDGGGYYLKNALCDFFTKKGINLTHEEIILGNGSNELLDIAVRTYMGYGDEAIFSSHSFVVYPLAVQSVGGISKEIPHINYKHNLLKMAEAITEKTKIVFIANPNNPTGTCVKKDEFEMFMERVPEGVLVIVDEAYYEYVTEPDYPDTFRYFNEGRDILILRTFSKAYGLAGLRIGYGIAKKEIIIEMNKIREPFNTNSLAQVAATHALNDDEHVRKTIENNEAGKRYLYEELKKLGINFVPTETNFIYIPLDIDSQVLFNALLQMGVIIRPVGPKAVRVTIGLPHENERFIESLKIALAKII